MSEQNPIRIYNGNAYEEEGPWCMLCGMHLGNYLLGININDFRRDPMTKWDSYDGGCCFNCNQEYSYNEGYDIILTDHQIELLKKDKKLL